MKNIGDFEDEELPSEVQASVRRYVALGYTRSHLCLTEDGQVLLDKELAENDAFDELIYDPAKDQSGQISK